MTYRYEVIKNNGTYYIVSTAFRGDPDRAICACMCYSSANKIVNALNRARS